MTCDCDCHKNAGLGTRVDKILSPEDLAELIKDLKVPPLPPDAIRRRRRRLLA